MMSTRDAVNAVAARLQTVRFRYEYVRRSGRLVSLPWVVWRVLPRSRRRRVSKTGVSSYSRFALLASDGPKRRRS